MSASPLSPNSIGNDRYLICSNTETGITATASGTQTTGYPLTAQTSEVTTVASPNDSVLLPKIQPVAVGTATPGQNGMVMFVRNEGANSMQVYGVSPDTINGAATGTGVAVPNGKTAIFIAYDYNPTTTVGQWMMCLSA